MYYNFYINKPLPCALSVCFLFICASQKQSLPEHKKDMGQGGCCFKSLLLLGGYLLNSNLSGQDFWGKNSDF
ncbi:hypothetical protein XELAEV_18012584mg [Xenopus laevis]|uniref:Uncharacterized protein n=1 Tax=Xenopus laevis TaxID=8355 RepID=A0A974DPS4_XENLA|nr:hypothetical protein XELAEV_18012584mg [Xenopus laevis]